MYGTPVTSGSRPSIGSVIGSSLRDTLAVTMTQRKAYIVLMALACASALFAVAVFPGADPIRGLRFSFALGGIGFFFAFPAVIRTFFPEFRLTFGNFAVLVAIGIAFAVVVELGLLLLIVPGVFLAVRWYFAPIFGALGENGNPFALSWRITRGSFWPTFGLLVAASLIAGAAVFVCAAIAAGFAFAFAASAVIFAPLVTAAYILAINFQYLAVVRWMMALRDGAMPAVRSSAGWSPAV